MMYELRLLNLPQQKATTQFKDFIEKKFSLSNFKLVHAQTESNEKMILLRLRSKPKFDEVNRQSFEFEGLDVEIKNHYRPEIHRINNLLQNVEKKAAEGKTIDGLEKISKIYISNIHDSTSEGDLYQIFSKFGDISHIEIQKRNEQVADRKFKKQKKINFRRAIVSFERFQDAVSAFYEDKLDIKGRFLKIKMYIPKNFSKRMKNLKKKNQTQKKKISGKKNTTEKKQKISQNKIPQIQQQNTTKKNFEKKSPIVLPHNCLKHMQFGLQTAPTPTTASPNMYPHGLRTMALRDRKLTIPSKVIQRLAHRYKKSNFLQSTLPFAKDEEHRKRKISIRKGLEIEMNQRFNNHGFSNLRLNGNMRRNQFHF